MPGHFDKSLDIGIKTRLAGLRHLVNLHDPLKNPQVTKLSDLNVCRISQNFVTQLKYK